jgi:hypothetical protein
LGFYGFIIKACLIRLFVCFTGFFNGFNTRITQKTKGYKMKKLFIVLFIILITSQAQCIELTTTGVYLHETTDNYHMVVIQGAFYAVTSVVNTHTPGGLVLINFELNNNDLITDIVIIKSIK